MTRSEHDKLLEICAKEPFFTARVVREYLATIETTEEPKGKRTSAQNRALHLDCKLISEKLNDAGYDMKSMLTVDIPWTTENVKEYLWKYFMHKLYPKITSTRELSKTEGQIEKVHETLMRELGEKKGIEWHDFPSDENKQKEAIGGYRTNAGETPDGVVYQEMDESNSADKF